MVSCLQTLPRCLARAKISDEERSQAIFWYFVAMGFLCFMALVVQGVTTLVFKEFKRSSGFAGRMIHKGPRGGVYRKRPDGTREYLSRDEWWAWEY